MFFSDELVHRGRAVAGRCCCVQFQEDCDKHVVPDSIVRSISKRVESLGKGRRRLLGFGCRGPESLLSMIRLVS